MNTSAARAYHVVTQSDGKQVAESPHEAAALERASELATSAFAEAVRTNRHGFYLLSYAPSQGIVLHAVSRDGHNRTIETWKVR